MTYQQHSVADAAMVFSEAIAVPVLLSFYCFLAAVAEQIPLTIMVAVALTHAGLSFYYCSAVVVVVITVTLVITDAAVAANLFPDNCCTFARGTVHSAVPFTHHRSMHKYTLSKHIVKRRDFYR